MRILGVLWFVIGAGLVGCAPPPLVGAGKPCNSLSDCKPGLSCVEGACDEDTASVAGQIPSYQDAAASTSGDAGTS